MSRNESSNSVCTPYKAGISAHEKELPSAETRLRKGKTLLIMGTIIVMLGIVLHCTTVFIGDSHAEPEKFMTEGLVVMGVGLALWLVGAVKYLNAAIDVGYDDDRL